MPTLLPVDDLYFDPEQDAQQLQEALTTPQQRKINGKKIIDVFYARTASQRMNVSYFYEKNFGVVGTNPETYRI